MPNDWNECLPWTGPESQLPSGMGHLPMGISVLDLLQEGSVKRTRSGGVLTLKIDEEVYQALVETYGSSQILISTAQGGRMTREEWYEKYNHSDGLKLAIIRELNKDGDTTPFNITDPRR